MGSSHGLDCDVIEERAVLKYSDKVEGMALYYIMKKISNKCIIIQDIIKRERFVSFLRIIHVCT